jgi:hypothetical protein
MQRLVSEIEKELEQRPHCAIYEPELSRIWPESGAKRKEAIKHFAEEHRWRIRYYKDGFLVIFDKPDSVNRTDGSALK